MIALDVSRHKSFACVAKVEGLIVMMGSNDDAQRNLLLATQAICQNPMVASCQPICEHISADHTGRAINLYHNQALMVWLNDKCLLSDIVQMLKDIEQLCGRDPCKNSAAYGYLVAMDIDVMAVNIYGDWFMIQERLPLKAHERICLNLPL